MSSSSSSTFSFSFTCIICMETITCSKKNELNKKKMTCCTRHEFCMDCVMKSYKNAIQFFDEVYFPTTSPYSMDLIISSIVNKTCFECKKPWEYKSWVSFFFSLECPLLRKKLIQMQGKHALNSSLKDKYMIKSNALVKVRCIDIFNCTGFCRHYTDDPIIIHQAIENHSPTCQGLFLSTFDAFLKEKVTIDMLKTFFSSSITDYSLDLMEIMINKPVLASTIQLFLQICESIDRVEEFYYNFADVYLFYLVNLCLFPHCSRCKIPQEKSDACNHMTCQKCTAETCYVCGKHFPTMISLDQYMDYQRDWKLGLLNTSITSNAITWYDHVCPIYSLKIFSDLHAVTSSSSSITFPTNELEASIILRKVYFLIVLFKKNIPIKTLSIVERIYPEFPKIPLLHGYMFELFSGKITFSKLVSKIKKEEGEKEKEEKREKDSLSAFYDFSGYFSCAI